MTRLRVAVVGAGIAGLAAAAWLRRPGIACVVYERTRRLGEIGAGVQIGPNATRLLHRLGLADDLYATGVRPAAVEMRHWRTGATTARTLLGASCEATFGAPYYTVHRADLHRALRRRVDHVDLGRHCVGVTEREGEVELRFDDGGTEVADLVIGADGIRSVVRGALVRDVPVFSGITVYRGLTRRIGGGCAVMLWLGPGQHCVCYPISGGRLNVVATAPVGRTQTSTESWTAPGRVADVVAAYQGWHDDVVETLSSLESVTRWALHERPQPPRLCSDRIALVGDAAHPMLPFGAQGASQAIEDAAALATCLSGIGPADLAPALRRYEHVRGPRLARVAATVGVHRAEHHLADGPRQRERDRTLNRRMRLDGQRWLYGYDAERAALVGRNRP
jgi:salicylate hydroxylase